MRAVLLAFAIFWAALTSGVAQDLSALARLEAGASSIRAEGGGVSVTLAISQPVPWRVRLLDGPPRLVLDVREVDWAGIGEVTRSAPQVRDVRAGVFRPGWSRLVLELSGPMHVAESEMQTGADGAAILLRLEPAEAEAFRAEAARPEPPDWAAPKAADLPPPVARGEGPVVVVLDPGHGGIDPGAERDGEKEAELMLTFARELKDLLSRDGRFRVVMTRDDDVFVPLETRISIARAAGAQIFISLHADALAEGEAQGATIYTLSEEASDEASAALAERHDRDDLLAGVDLSAQDDVVATVLMDMARTETAPRVARLAKALVVSIKAAGVKMHRHPHQEAGFSVLKSPDIPSILVEVGFLSSARDLKRLTDKDWRAKMAEALRQGLVTWSEEDAAIRALRAEQ
ncbi:N-acetylmuramoyl-L-alanine amidase [Rhodobacter sp. Har01]|uniref:N-acetylmuramoyl-L-alanine amidase n=1 Tax=Rhodobacter sp. Har01 TaxID=2883999 RepID=UPI001D079BAB|nr:N-acetylmuramoyl-L-alanine amidase [Rhodobacter sp. Har01]MCB6177176.1 N-acetylmuramoyl-L-alanine amidase [Rhodobacter sp. Har01]